MTSYATTSPALDNALVDPTKWADEQWLQDQMHWLRQNDPVRYCEPEGFDPFWSITKYADIKEIELDKKTFINDPRPLLGPKMLDALIEHMLGRRHLVRSLVQMDDPDHMQYRMLTQGWFMGQNIRRLQARIDELATQYVDRMAELGGRCDFVKDVAVWYPLRVIMSILGVPEQDEPLMLKLTQELFGGADPDTTRSFEPESILDVVNDFENYFSELTQQRRKNPTGDVASLIANANIRGESLPAHETNSYYMIIATAGHDTTSSSLAGGLLALMENPAQLALLRERPEERMASAVDEIIRWVTPVRQFCRTATADYSLNTVKIAEGDSCALWYPSANRDESVFEQPFEFRIDRDDSKHLAFGFGAHVCLGQHLARMELVAFYKELLRRVEHIELAGEPQYSQSIFVGGLKSLPVQFRMR